MARGDIFSSLATRAFRSGVSTGIVPMRRVQAKGEMQLAVTA